jgi:selenoprotein W-related protein
MLITSTKNKHIVNIEYCTQCRWLLRAAWMAQELLTTFEDELKAVSLQPGTGGVFEVRLNGTVLFNRKDHGRFPESKELKQYKSFNKRDASWEVMHGEK